MITREEMLKYELTWHAVDTEAWGTCFVRELAAAEFEAILALFDMHEGSVRLAALTILGLCDAAGQRVLRDEDLPRLLKGPLEPITTIASHFLLVNGLNADEEKKSSIPSSPSDTSSLANWGNPSRSA